MTRRRTVVWAVSAAKVVQEAVCPGSLFRAVEPVRRVLMRPMVVPVAAAAVNLVQTVQRVKCLFSALEAGPHLVFHILRIQRTESNSMAGLSVR